MQVPWMTDRFSIFIISRFALIVRKIRTFILFLIYFLQNITSAFIFGMICSFAVFCRVRSCSVVVCGWNSCHCERVVRSFRACCGGTSACDKIKTVVLQIWPLNGEPCVFARIRSSSLSLPLRVSRSLSHTANTHTREWQTVRETDGQKDRERDWFLFQFGSTRWPLDDRTVEFYSGDEGRAKVASCSCWEMKWIGNTLQSSSISLSIRSVRASGQVALPGI